jgi:predicted RNA-binding Zn-ribbon protein involved in translation (DUF1610 family)
MGIDAEMFVRTKAKVTAEEVREWAYRLGETFGPENFWIWKDERKIRHCLEIIKVYHQDGPDIKPKHGETFVGVYPATRYYGPGYERGDLPLLVMISEWLEENIPGAEVWYGGDSSGVEAEKFDRRARNQLIRHFNKYGHAPYHGHFDRKDDDVKAPICKCCWKKMRRYGWGKNYAAFTCGGCGEDVLTTDGGKTFSARVEDWEAATGRPFSCPQCKTELVTRDAGKTFAALDNAKKVAEAEKKRKEEKKKADGK